MASPTWPDFARTFCDSAQYNADDWRALLAHSVADISSIAPVTNQLLDPYYSCSRLRDAMQNRGTRTLLQQSSPVCLRILDSVVTAPNTYLCAVRMAIAIREFSTNPHQILRSLSDFNNLLSAFSDSATPPAESKTTERYPASADYCALMPPSLKMQDYAVVPPRLLPLMWIALRDERMSAHSLSISTFWVRCLGALRITPRYKHDNRKMPEINALRNQTMSILRWVFGTCILGMRTLRPLKYQVGYVCTQTYSKQAHNRVAEESLLDVTQRMSTLNMRCNTAVDKKTLRIRGWPDLRHIEKKPCTTEQLVHLSALDQFAWLRGLAVCVLSLSSTSAHYPCSLSPAPQSFEYNTCAANAMLPREETLCPTWNSR